MSSCCLDRIDQGVRNLDSLTWVKDEHETPRQHGNPCRPVRPLAQLHRERRPQLFVPLDMPTALTRNLTMHVPAHTLTA